MLFSFQVQDNKMCGGYCMYFLNHVIKCILAVPVHFVYLLFRVELVTFHMYTLSI